MDDLRETLLRLSDYDVLLLRIGTLDLTLFGLARFLGLIGCLFYGAELVRRWLVTRVLARTGLDLGVRLTIGAFVRYSVLIVGFLAIAQTLGINLSAFSVLAGAVGVGVGFGLQNIVSNFISGLIIMIERPVRVGDRIELGTLEGDVTDIGARRTTVVTNDFVTLYVPNSRFITENVVNLRNEEGRVRLRLPVTIAANADLTTARSVLLDVAARHADVLPTPAPAVALVALQAAGAITLELQVWNANRIHAREDLRSELYFSIHAQLSAQAITLA